MNELARLFKESQRWEGGVSYIERGAERFVSYKDMYSLAADYASRWQALDLRDRFIAAIWMDHGPHYLIAFMAIVLKGGIPIPLHTHYSHGEVERICARFETDMLISTPDKLAKGPARRAKLTGTGMNHVNGLDGGLIGYGLSSTECGERRRRYTPPEETAVIFLTSGSTGMPKGVMLNCGNIVSNVHAIQKYVRLKSSDRILVTKSLGYSSTVTGEWLLALLCGAGIHMAEGWVHPLEWVRTVRNHGITFLCTVPPAAVSLVKSAKWKADDLPELKQMVIIGGGMPPDLLLELQSRMPKLRLVVSYGLTEASPRVSYLPPEELAARPGSVGIGVERTEIRIFRNGNGAASNETGEIVVRGPGVMVGYYDDSEATAEVLQGGWLHTSDMGYMDNQGFLYVTGRKDSAMNIGGTTIYPEPIEQTLMNHEGVEEAAIVGLPDEMWGQRMIACIKPADDSFEVEELYKYCQEHLRSVERPRMIRVWKQLPKTGSGKLDRRTLKLWIEEGENESASS